MKPVIKYLLIIIAIFLIGLMLYASISKILIMNAVKSNPELFNSRSIDYHYRHNQILSYIHIISGMIFLLAGAYQFIPFFRNRYFGFHRMVGKLFLATSLIVAVSALIMGFYFPFGDFIETATTFLYGIFLIAGTYFAYSNARKSNIRLHKNWVLRVYFVALSIASIRIVAGIGMAITGNSLKEMLGISFAIAFTLHFIMVECWIRFTR